MGGYVLFEVNAAVRKLAELSSSLDLYWAKSQSASVISLSCHVHPRPDILFRHHVVSMIPIPVDQYDFSRSSLSFFLWAMGVGMIQNVPAASSAF